MTKPPPRVAVAASGGRDSTALLHCTVRQAAPLGVEVIALHVHHGLMPDADAWLERVKRQAVRWGAGFRAARLEGKPAKGDSVEAWARRERYAALTRLACDAGCELVLLAQHRRDQAETFVVQALRGGGAAGLAAMPRLATRAGITWARPWLTSPREVIDAYLRRHHLRPVEDPSNSDARFARGRLRALWPAWSKAFPDAEATLAAAARRAAEDAALVAEVAAQELKTLGAVSQPLPVARWLFLSSPRRIAVLRAWLAGVLPQPVPETLVRRLMEELPGRHHARWPAGARDLVLKRGLLAPEPAAPRRLAQSRAP
jgi:tRNA(Ile)-lysidine synthase